jgi:hypothetical protein
MEFDLNFKRKKDNISLLWNGNYKSKFKMLDGTIALQLKFSAKGEQSCSMPNKLCAPDPRPQCRNNFYVKVSYGKIEL